LPLNGRLSCRSRGIIESYNSAIRHREELLGGGDIRDEPHIKFKKTWVLFFDGEAGRRSLWSLMHSFLALLDELDRDDGTQDYRSAETGEPSVAHKLLAWRWALGGEVYPRAPDCVCADAAVLVNEVHDG
jgi:hypothetical protein